ncbi:quinone oxidoreductase [Rothia terrae]
MLCVDAFSEYSGGMNKSMKATSISEIGAPSVLQSTQIQTPTPGKNQVLVKTAAVGVNFIETYQRSGVYPVQLPFIPGSEAAGTVVELGEAVHNIQVGQRVATASATHTYAEYFLVDAQKCVAIPDSVSDEDAAAVPLQGMTAHYLINSTFNVKAEHTVVFHAGAGGVGGIALQLLKAKGATVIATVSTDAKEKIAYSHGADHVVRYENFADRVLEITDEQGVDVVYDSVGKDTFDDSLRCLKKRGMMVLFGGASGQVPPLDPQKLNQLGSLFLTRPTLADYTLTREEISWRMGDLFDAITAGTLTVTVDQVFPLKDAASAHEYLEARKTRGKVVLVP